MKKTSFGIVALLGLSLAVPAFAEEPAANSPPGKPGVTKPGPVGPTQSRPGSGHGPGPGRPMGPHGMPMGPHGMPMGPHGNMSPEELAKRTEEMKARMAERSEKVAARAKELREKAAKARASGDVKQAEQLEKAAERLEKGPPTPNRGPAWKKAMHKRKLARLKPLWKQYGERLHNPDVRAEFKKHATRMARLERIRNLAKNNPDEQAREKLTERINTMMAKENARHRQTLRNLMDKKEQVVPANEPASSGSAAPAASEKSPEGKLDEAKPAPATPAANPPASAQEAK
jgi:hypothetical protein